MRYKRNDRVMVNPHRLTPTSRPKEMVIVAPWAKGEGDGYAAKLPGQANHECVDVPARRIAGPAKG